MVVSIWWSAYAQRPLSIFLSYSGSFRSASNVLSFDSKVVSHSSVSLAIPTMSEIRSKKSPAVTSESRIPSDQQWPLSPFDKVTEGKILRKLDLTVLPILWLLYIVCLVDRTNIGNAKIQGMDKELDLKGQRYNIAVFMFNIGFLVAGVPLSIVFKKTGPKSLAVMMFCWGKLENTNRTAGSN